MQNPSRRRVLLAGASLTATTLAGCSDDGGGGNNDTIDPANRGPITIAELAFTAGRPDGLDEYQLQPSSTYDPDQPIWLYADVSGLAGQPIESEADAGGSADATVAIDLQKTVSVEDPDGDIVVESADTFQEELAAGQLDAYFTATEILLAGRAAAGEYVTTLSVTDGVSETQATDTATFRIEE